jgi:hypothetical protein
MKKVGLRRRLSQTIDAEGKVVHPKDQKPLIGYAKKNQRKNQLFIAVLIDNLKSMMNQELISSAHSAGRR